MNEKKRIATEFLKMIIEGKIDEAYEKYVDVEGGKHHNLYFAKGFPALRAAMKEAHTAAPNKILTMKNIIQDENVVCVHSSLVINEEKSMAVCHIMRIVDGKIVELWDVGSLIPSSLPNDDGPF